MSDLPNINALLDEVEATWKVREDARQAFEADPASAAKDDAFSNAEAACLDVADVAVPVLVVLIRGFLEMRRDHLRAFLERIDRELAARDGGEE